MKIDRSKYNVVEVVRGYENSYGTFGRLFVNDEFICYTLEPCSKESRKGYKPFRIPAGTYDLSMNVVSPKYRYRSPYLQFKGRVPRVLNVPGFDGILIHIGNWLKDTLGCILVGEKWDFTRLYNSTKAYLGLFYKLDSFKYPIKIVISDEIKG